MPSPIRAGMKRKASEDLEQSEGKANKISKPNEERASEDHQNEQHDQVTDAKGQVHAGPISSNYDGAENGRRQDAEKSNDEPDSRQESETEDQIKTNFANQRGQACELLKQLVILLESRRKVGSEVDQTHLTHVCKLATQPEMDTTPYLKALPVSWFQDAEELQAAQDRRMRLEDDLQHHRTEYYGKTATFHAAVSERTQILLDATDDDPWPATAEEQDRLASAALEKVLEVRGQLASVEKQVKASRAREDSIGEALLSTAEDVMVELDLLPPVDSVSSKDSREHLASRRSDCRGQSAHSDVDDRPPENGTKPKEEANDPPPRTMKDYLREEKRRQFRVAKRERSVASAQCTKNRNTYNHEFRKFWKAKKSRKIIGTKTDFDYTYFMELNRATNDLVLAEERLAYARKQAQDIGALRREEVTSDYGDWSDDGYIANSDKDDPIWEMGKERIEGWLMDDQTQELLTQDPLHNECDRRGDSGGKSIASAHGYDPDYMATGKRRKRIDDWIAEQEKLRKATSLGQDMSPGGQVVWHLVLMDQFSV